MDSLNVLAFLPNPSASKEDYYYPPNFLKDEEEAQQLLKEAQMQNGVLHVCTRSLVVDMDTINISS